MVSSFTRVQYYQERAAKLRALAASEKIEQKRISLLKLADSYERLAETLSGDKAARLGPEST